MTAELRFDVYGVRIAVQRTADGWQAFALGADGKRRRADFEVPAFIGEDEVGQYLADLFHDSASAAHPDVVRIG